MQANNVQTAGRLIEEIVTAARIPSKRRRREVSRELQAHMEDLVLRTRDAGHSDEEVQRLAVASFGDPREIARQFAWVYRKERAVLGLTVFVLSTIAVAASIAAVVTTMKAAIAIGLGVPLFQMFNPHHSLIEGMDILATAAAYVGLMSLEKLFEQHRFQKATGLLVLMIAIIAVLLRLAGAPWQFLLFGLVSGVFLRTIQVLLTNQVARIVIVTASFGLLGLISFRPLHIASWLVTGLAYQTMTHLAARVDRALFKGLQQL
jgi:hypothetical protein